MKQQEEDGWRVGEMTDKVVCVTGASGYIASCLVNLLLHRGYTVNATVRNPNDPAKTEHLLGLEGAKQRLRLFKADLLEEGSFDSAIFGCQGVFHTASPVDFHVTDAQAAEILDPAVKGTLNVLAACKRTPSVRRVIVTSSMATVLYTGIPVAPEVVVDETWFSTLEYCHKFASAKWYSISKILAEEGAWKFCKENDIDLISINPSMVIGPVLPSKLSDSVAIILSLITGTKTYRNVAWPWVHIEDVAEAHIRAFEMPSAHGRYCLAERVVHHSEIVNMLRELFPSLQLPDKCADDGHLAKTYQVSKAKVRCLGIDYIPLKEAIKDTVESFKERKLLLTS